MEWRGWFRNGQFPSKVQVSGHAVGQQKQSKALHCRFVLIAPADLYLSLSP